MEFRRPTGFDAVPASYAYNWHYGAAINDVVLGEDPTPGNPCQGTEYPTLRRVYPVSVDCSIETPMHQSYDCALMVGRTFSDYDNGIFLTATGIMADTISVVVNYLKDFPNNRPPSVSGVSTQIAQVGSEYDVTFTASATDPDGDALVYFWNYEVDLYKTRLRQTNEYLTDSFYKPGTFGNGQVSTHRYQSNTPRRAYLLVSDLKGGLATTFEVPLWGFKPDTVFVGPTAPDKPTIQEGIDQAVDGNVVLVKPKSAPYYREGGINPRSKRIKVLAQTSAVYVNPTTAVDGVFQCVGTESRRTVIDGMNIIYGSIGVKCRNSAKPTITNCSMVGLVEGQSGTPHGIVVEQFAWPVVSNCLFRAIRGASEGGGIYVASRVGATTGFNSNQALGSGGLSVRNCTFDTNEAGDGAGLFYKYVPDNSQPMTLAVAAQQPPKLEIENCLFSSNTAYRNGGGIAFDNVRKGAKIVNCTITHNVANSSDVPGHGGGIFFGSNVDTVKIENCILWKNRLDELHPSSDLSRWWQVYPTTLADSLDILVQYSCIEDWWARTQFGNTKEDPRFVGEPPSADYHLAPFSPAIDAARGSWLAAGSDMVGIARFDDPAVPNTGVGVPVYIDIGANERSTSSGYSLATVAKETEKKTNSSGGETPPICDSQTIHIGRRVNGGNTFVSRAFMDFDTSQIPNTAVIDGVELVVKIQDGNANAGMTIDAKAMSQTVASYGSNCPTLHGSISSSTTYVNQSGWGAAQGALIMMNLGTQARSDLQSRLSADWFAVGLKSNVESINGIVEIHGSDNVLRVWYHLP